MFTPYKYKRPILTIIFLILKIQKRQSFLYTDIHPQEVHATIYEDEYQGTCFLIDFMIY